MSFKYKSGVTLGLLTLLSACGLTPPVSGVLDTAPAGANPTISIRPADDIKKSSFIPVISTSSDSIAAGLCLDASTPTCTASTYNQFVVPIYKNANRNFYQLKGNMLIADGLQVTLLSQKVDGTTATRKLTFHCKSGSPVAGCSTSATAAAPAAAAAAAPAAAAAAAPAAAATPAAATPTTTPASSPSPTTTPSSGAGNLGGGSSPSPDPGTGGSGW
jgi:hypothetical protein